MVEERTDLPEGTQLTLVMVEADDEMTPEERAELEAEPERHPPMPPDTGSQVPISSRASARPDEVVVAPEAAAQILLRKNWWRANRSKALARFDDELPAKRSTTIAKWPESFPAFSGRADGSTLSLGPPEATFQWATGETKNGAWLSNIEQHRTPGGGRSPNNTPPTMHATSRPSKKRRRLRSRERHVQSTYTRENPKSIPEPSEAGCTGLEPAASAVTGGKGVLGRGGRDVQTVDIVRSQRTPNRCKSQPIAPILDDLLTTFLQGFMTVSQVADRLGVCRSTVYQLCERGEIPHVRVSNAIRVPVEALAEYVGRASK